MNELIEAIKAWPVIVQGALGSALFSVVLVVGQWSWRRCARSYSHHSQATRESWLINQHVKYLVRTSEFGIPTIEGLLWIFYRASRPVIKALLWLVYGLILNSIFPLAGVIAFAVCIWYLFRAFEIVGPIEEMDDEAAKIKLAEIQDELNKLQGTRRKRRAPELER